MCEKERGSEKSGDECDNVIKRELLIESSFS
jgi:hypothetical protein